MFLLADALLGWEEGPGQRGWDHLSLEGTWLLSHGFNGGSAADAGVITCTQGLSLSSTFWAA